LVVAAKEASAFAVSMTDEREVSAGDAKAAGDVFLLEGNAFNPANL
jgi:hypothetical protein